jgi:DNA polymerase-4
MQQVLVDLAGGVAEWLVGHDVWARTVTIKVRYDDFTTVTRSATGAPVQSHEDIAQRAVALLEKTEAHTRAVRLLGVSAHGLGPRQPPMNPEWLPFGE